MGDLKGSIVGTYGKEFEIKGKEAIRVRGLEAIPADTEAWTMLETDEFTILCPFSGLPDFAKLAIRFKPNGKVVEHKSLKVISYQLQRCWYPAGGGGGANLRRLVQLAQALSP